MYQIVIYLYLCGVAIASLFSEKVRKMWRGEREAIRVLKEKVDPEAQYVWFHAASLGEFEQGRPLMERLRREHPEYKILLTFFSPSGYEVRKNYEGADIICYLPLDTIRNARRFLRAVRPCMAFFITYEIYSVSSIFRPEQVFFRWYGRQYGRVLKCFTRFFVQNEQSRELLKTLGITDVEVVGDTRFDRVLQIKEQAKQLPLVEQFIRGAGKPHVFVAGSSWPPDEEIFLRYFREHPEWTLIIAPHVIGEDHLQQIEKLLDGFHVERYTQLKAPLSSPEGDTSASSVTTNAIEAPSGAVGGARALIIDCFGLLSSIYRYGQVAYVGGGFGVGIHNVVEAAVWGMPVFFGPNNQRFREAQELKQNGGGIEINSYDDFACYMDELAANPKMLAERGRTAGDYVTSRAGATEKIFKYLQL